MENAISHCNHIVGDNAAAPDRRGQALAQRGLMHAKRWSVISSEADALQGIQDITEGLRLHVPPAERRHQLLLIRGQLFVAFGQYRRAIEDFKAILFADPANNAAQQWMKRAVFFLDSTKRGFPPLANYSRRRFRAAADQGQTQAIRSGIIAISELSQSAVAYPPF